jgi:hypothetical protein
MSEVITHKVVEYDCETGKSIERDMTVQEAEAHEARQADAQEAYEAALAAAEAKAAAAASAADKLAKLGLTEEEIAALRG